jgi:hypothetical protein
LISYPHSAGEDLSDKHKLEIQVQAMDLSAEGR